MNIATLFDAFKKDCPIMAERTVSYTANKAGVNSILITLDDNSVVTYTKGANATLIDIRR